MNLWKPRVRQTTDRTVRIKVFLCFCEEANTELLAVTSCPAVCDERWLCVTGQYCMGCNQLSCCQATNTAPQRIHGGLQRLQPWLFAPLPTSQSLSVPVQSFLLLYFVVQLIYPVSIPTLSCSGSMMVVNPRCHQPRSGGQEKRPCIDSQNLDIIEKCIITY